jgi:hypothetical protein
MLIFKAGIGFVLYLVFPLPLPRINSMTELIFTRNRFCGISLTGVSKSLKNLGSGQVPSTHPSTGQSHSFCHRHALQKQNTGNSKQIFPEKEYRGLSPNFHIHVSVRGLYIPTIGLPILLEEIHVDLSWNYVINRSQTNECGN